MANWWDEAPAAAPQSPSQINWWDEAPAQEPSAPEAWNPALGLSRDVVNGIPILGPMYTGAVDAVTTNIMGMITGEDPQAIKDRVYAKQDQYEAENPVLSAGGQIVGGMAAMAPLGATAAGAKALGIAPGKSLLSRALLGGMSGFGVTGADAVVRGTPIEEAWKPALVGGGLGAGFGAAAPVIGNGVSRAADLLRRATGNAPVMPPNLSRPSADILSDVLAADNALGNTGVTNISKGGPGAMLVDASPNAQSLLDAAIQRSGTGSSLAKEAIEARASQANIDITKALDDALGSPQGVHTAETTLRMSTAGPRSQAYQAAYAQPIDYAAPAGMEIEQLVKRVPQSVIDRANLLMQLDGRQSKQIMAQVAEDGTVTYMRMPDVEQLDYITRALNTAANSTEGQGAMGGMTDIGNAYKNLSRDLRGTVRAAVPEYDTALQTAAQPIRQRESLQLGADLLSPKVPRDVAADEIAAMTAPELTSLRQGIRSQIDEALANVRAVASDPNIDARAAQKALSDLSSVAAREKITMAIGDEAAQALFQQLDEAARALNLRANVATNSRTFPRLAMDERVKAYTEGGLWNQALQGKPVNTVQSAIQNITGRTPEGIGQMNDKVYEELVSALTGLKGDEAIDFLSMLGRYRQTPKHTPGYLPGAAAPAAQQISQMILGNVAQ